MAPSRTGAGAVKAAHEAGLGFVFDCPKSGFCLVPDGKEAGIGVEPILKTDGHDAFQVVGSAHDVTRSFLAWCDPETRAILARLPPHLLRGVAEVWGQMSST